MAAPWAAATTVSVSATCLRRSPTSATRRCRRGAPHSPAQDRWRCRGRRRQRTRSVRPSCAARRPQFTQVAASAPLSPAQERRRRRGLRRLRVRSVRPACASRRPQLRAVAAGARLAVVPRSAGGAVGCGGNEFGQCDLPAPLGDLSYTQVAAGARHTALLRSDGSAVGCGDHCSVRSTCLCRTRPQLHAGCCRSELHEPAQE